MSEPAIFAFVRNGESRFFADRWASVFLFREILWGPEDFEHWATAHEELGEFTVDCSGGVVVDNDRKRLVWCVDSQGLHIPRIKANYSRLLQAAWPEYAVSFAEDGMKDLAEAAGVDEQIKASGEGRPNSVSEAVCYGEVDVEDDVESEDEEAFDEDDTRAWITMVDLDGTVRHRYLERLSKDLFTGEQSALKTLAEMPPVQVPPEKVVAEGMWIDEPGRTIGVWGVDLLRKELPKIGACWSDWTVRWAEGGYADQCKISGHAGQPLGDAESLAKILPVVLSTERFDMSSILRAIGGGIKKTAIKATGCLLFIALLPLVIFGVLSGLWTPVIISITITLVVVVAIFKFIEYRLKKSLGENVPAQGADEDIPPTAGPLDPALRRQRIDQLLAAAKLPPLADVEPLFPERSELDLID